MRIRRTVEYTRAPRGPRDNPWIWIGLLAATVVALALVVWALARDNGDGGGRERNRTVPNLVGLDQADAGGEAQRRGFVVDTYGVPAPAPFGQVVGQEPDAGARLAAGRHLRLNISAGTDARPAVQGPDVTGPPAGAAREALWRLGLTVLTVERDAPSGDAVGTVLDQRPAAGRNVPPLTQVTLYVGR